MKSPSILHGILALALRTMSKSIEWPNNRHVLIVLSVSLEKRFNVYYTYMLQLLYWCGYGYVSLALHLVRSLARSLSLSIFHFSELFFSCYSIHAPSNFPLTPTSLLPSIHLRVHKYNAIDNMRISACAACMWIWTSSEVHQH